MPNVGDADGGLVFACIAPHGDLAISQACPPDQATLATATQDGMTELARRFDAAAPDVVVLLTPHGIHVEGHFAVVVAGRSAGALAEAPAIALDLEVDRELALAVVRALGNAGIPAVGVSFGGNVPAEAVMPLDWGSLIPLWYLGGRGDPAVRVVIVAPARDRSIDEHLAVGSAIAAASARSGRRVALVASADQAHTHDAEGPYGFDPAARTHDELVVSLLRAGRLGMIGELDLALVKAAKPDAWWQELMLLGAIGEAWSPRVLSYEAPTDYGMLCAWFEPPGNVDVRRETRPR
jgi:aromatic ring-opening dioxygenase LigB subunit